MISKKLVVVDDNDTVLETKEKTRLEPEDIYRLATLWLIGPGDRILLAQRSFSRKHSPGKWGPAVAGTVEEGQDYDATILRESREEIGIDIPPADLKKGPKIRIRRKDRPDYFGQWYVYKMENTPARFNISEEEVQQVKWFSKEEILRAALEHPTDFVASMPQWLPQLVLNF